MRRHRWKRVRGVLRMPMGDRRLHDWQAVDKLRVTMETRLGPLPSFALVQAGETILRLRFEIALLERRRDQQGALSAFDSELLMRLENGLARALRRWEDGMLKPCPPSLREHLETLAAARTERQTLEAHVEPA